MNILDKINNGVDYLEQRGWIERTPAFIHDYQHDYPQFKLIEDNYKIIREECLNLLNHKDELTDVETLAGDKTKGGIHSIKWKSLMFKSGDFIESNCALCPETTKLLRKLPQARSIFFSILDPNQYIKAHWGYYKGFVRYHLAVIIPDNNAEQKCWLRINGDRSDNLKDDKALIENGEYYYWKEGQGIMFNDTYLHDAANYSDEIRVVIWIDVDRKLPWIFSWINKLIIKIGLSTSSIKKIAKMAEVKLYK